MVDLLGLQSKINARNSAVSFGAKRVEKETDESLENNKLMIDEVKKNPIGTAIKINKDKFQKAFTEYPKRGLEGSKNANFYQFLTMGMVPYLTGSAAMIGVFNVASKFFDTPSAKSATKLGKKMGIGVVLYGLGKTLSKKLIEKPVKWKYGIDVNLPYRKAIKELPEANNKDNLLKHEYHKVFESVDFPYWDMLYGQKAFGENRNAYFDKVAKKMGMGEVEHSDQKVKDKIREKLVKTRLFTTLSSYLWAATGVGIAMQKPWENLIINPKVRYNNFANHVKTVANSSKDLGGKAKDVLKYDFFLKDFGKKLGQSCKDLVTKGTKANKYAGRALLGSAIAVTLLGNFKTLFDFNNKGRKVSGSSPLIDDSKEKVVC